MPQIAVDLDTLVHVKTTIKILKNEVETLEMLLNRLLPNGGGGE